MATSTVHSPCFPWGYCWSMMERWPIVVLERAGDKYVEQSSAPAITGHRTANVVPISAVCHCRMQLIYRKIRDFIRIAWVRIRGIPLQLWDSNFFMALSEKLGELIYIDDRSFHKTNLSGGFFCVMITEEKCHDPLGRHPLKV